MSFAVHPVAILSLVHFNTGKAGASDSEMAVFGGRWKG